MAGAAYERMDESFARVAARQPDAVAVEDRGSTVTYAGLQRAAERIADALLRAGVPSGGLVGLRAGRGAQAIAGMLGIWRHGCGYVPVDPRYPQARQDYLLADSGVGHVVTENAETGEPTVEPSGREPGGGAPVPPDTAYVIYTSGSTGDPKGVVVRHANVRALLDGCASYSVGPDDVWSFFHSPSFDFSVWEIWGALSSGGRVVVVPDELTTDPAALADLLAARKVTVLSQVPSVFAYLVRGLEDHPVPLPALRYVVFGGEAVNARAVRRWNALGLAPGAELHNMYGITEITVHATDTVVDAAKLRRHLMGTPIGRALPHLRIALLEDSTPVPPGVPGELHVAGAGVAHGYLGRPELTAQRFVRLDLDGSADVWYRTGDYAVAGEDGELEFLGRRDEQVKLRGFRIELGEIEAALQDLPEVRECAVVLTESPGGEPLLAACYVPKEGPVEDGLLREALGAVLPRHMLPSAYVSLPELPLTLSGKLDRGALVPLVAESAGPPATPGN
ncbi:ribosomal peptide synthetase [Streptomyces davaonensis JCM 4913]|uniref:Ribosomal peptide synthetase n=2 Tax=Streptomyces davaonensis TaxID=348043 RepID=K4R1H6_STRDJ|nr:ribosomal peptide synthetase [Streptomyces davaonensis JCM 4913]